MQSGSLCISVIPCDALKPQREGSHRKKSFKFRERRVFSVGLGRVSKKITLHVKPVILDSLKMTIHRGTLLMSLKGIGRKRWHTG